MLSRRIGKVVSSRDVVIQSIVVKFGGIWKGWCPQVSFSTALSDASKCVELPKKLKKSERKPLVTGINVLKQRARLEKKIRQEVRETVPKPPENGLLVEKLIPVAHDVYNARSMLFTCVSKVMKSIPVYTCGLCGEVHVGLRPNKIKSCIVPGNPSRKEHRWEKASVEHVLPLVESFHLYDRVGRAVSHGECLEVDRIPAIVELCVQAGLDILEYPTRRRTIPIYIVAGKIKDFEKRFPQFDSTGNDINEFGFWEKHEKPGRENKSLDLPLDDLQGFFH